MAVEALLNETELLHHVADGDQRAFKALFEHYEPYVYRVALKLTRSEDTAVEVVQDIFLQVWFGREKLSEIRSFGSYLNRLVRNRSLDLLRRMAVADRAEKEISYSTTERDIGTEQELDYQETLRILDEAVEKLPDQQRRVYELCHREGLKYEEAARELGISSATVHYHMKLALSAIRDHFRRSGAFYPAMLLFFSSHLR